MSNREFVIKLVELELEGVGMEMDSLIVVL